MGSVPDTGSGHAPALAGEQAALRRVATLVARAASQADVFAVVAEEIGPLVQADRTFLARYNPDQTATIVAAWFATGEIAPISHHCAIPEGTPAALLQATGPPVRIDRSPGDSFLASRCVRSGVTAPITVEGRLWGFMTVGSTTGQPLPPGTEARLADFAELVAAAIANADAREELRQAADEQAALRRVATLIARGAPPEELFAAVTEEVRRVLNADLPVSMNRYDPDGAVTVVGLSISNSGTGAPVGTRVRLGGRNVLTLVSETGRAARIDRYGVEASVRPPTSPASSAPIRSSACQLSWRVGCGASLPWHPWMSRCRRILAAAGRVHRAGRHRSRQRAGTHRTARLR